MHFSQQLTFKTVCLKASDRPTLPQNANRALVLSSASVCEESLQDLHDPTIFDKLYRVQKRNYKRAVMVLYWRSIQMSSAWHVFVHLVNRRFLSKASMTPWISGAGRPQ